MQINVPKRVDPYGSGYRQIHRVPEGSIMRTILLAATALFLAMGAVSAQQNSGPARGSGAGQDPAMAKKQADCHRQADEKGLRGQSKRGERQSFMSSCVHGQ
jgi:hypothetical protein